METTKDETVTPPDPATTRRRLLGAATSGFALAASGLFLPERLVEGAARAAAHGGELRGRHGKDRKGRHRKRTHGDTKGDRKESQSSSAPGGGLIRYVALRAITTDNLPYVDIDVYYRVKGSLDSWSTLFLAKSAEQLHTGHVDYAPDRYSVAAYFCGPGMPSPVFVEVRNPLIGAPFAQVKIGGSIVNGEIAGGFWVTPDGDIRIPFEEDSKWFTCWVGRGFADNPMWLLIRRVKDSDTHKWFKAEVTWHWS